MNGDAAKLKRLDQIFETIYQEKDSSGMVLIIRHDWFHSFEVLTCSFSHVNRTEMVWNSPKVNSSPAFIFFFLIVKAKSRRKTLKYRKI